MNYGTSNDSLDVRIPIGETEAPDYWNPKAAFPKLFSSGDHFY
jgi:hypothetical protein